MENVQKVFGEQARVTVVVGFKLEMIMEAHPSASFVYNEVYDGTNTSKSLLKALRASQESGVLWLNGDVVFDYRVLERVSERIKTDKSFVCVNTSAVADEEVKYTVDASGNINELSKTVKNGLGEAVGINFISSHEKAGVIQQLEACGDQDYFERGLELAIQNNGLKMEPVDISDLFAVEVDFQDDLDRANKAIQ
jgi:choline kinase